ncbi:OLC1v1013336C1 [Oldenlandia corymbosa var. corymbosa]|uniref:OLC1v1013336C1 n=1 Tax=Oldenlandia corymbosa var. corymbosa TaxID=529605 RepID=A0AAV1DYG2_OLDCO|nr:OLC1v1013336C1 [Oldenlandia corymbosa var. corymbosa]
MNPRHVLIRFELEEDYQRCWITSLWHIGIFQMRILKWQPRFKFEEDPPIVPIWVSLHELPLEWTHPSVLYSIASAVGKPLQVDALTLNLTRPSVARFCVEVDLLKELPKSIRIGKKGKKFEQFYTYEYVPAYCQSCCKIGHKAIDCRKGKGMINADLRKEEQAGMEKLAAEKGALADKVPAGNKNGFRINQKKVKWDSKRIAKKGELQVEIVNDNPLIIRDLSTKVTEAQVAGTLILQPAGIRSLDGATGSGLTEKEKASIIVDIESSPKRGSGEKIVNDAILFEGGDNATVDPKLRVASGLRLSSKAQGDFDTQRNSAQLETLENIVVDDLHLDHSAQGDAGLQLQTTQLDLEDRREPHVAIEQGNKFAMLQTCDDDCDASGYGAEDDTIIDLPLVTGSETGIGGPQGLNGGNLEMAAGLEKEAVTANFDNSDILQLGTIKSSLKYPMDSFPADSDDGSDAATDRGTWSEGDKERRASDTERGNRTGAKKKKRGRKTREQIAKELEGAELRRSLRFQ